jgi:hypothetical protein
LRLDVEADAFVDAFDRAGRSTNSRLPEACYVVVQRDGAVAGIDELAAFAVGAGPSQPRLGVFEHVERLVPDTGDTGDSVPGALAVAGGAFPLAGVGVLLLLDPTVFYVAGQILPSMAGCVR